MAEAWPTVAKVAAYQQGQMPMLFETLCVKVKLKFSVPRAGREIPSIFCSTQGPMSVSVVVPLLTDCHGQASLTCGRWMLIPTTCRVADSAASTAQAIALRKIRPARTRTAAHLSLRGMRRRGPARTVPGSRYGRRGGCGCGGRYQVSPSPGSGSRGAARP